MSNLLFLPRFWDQVRACEKRQTIRPPRKRPLKKGDRLSLRGWSDKPYRSPQVKLLEAVCTGTVPVRIESGEHYMPLDVEIRGVLLNPKEADHFARDDGFDDAEDMADFWGKTHAMPFVGVLITWVPGHVESPES